MGGAVLELAVVVTAVVEAVAGVAEGLGADVAKVQESETGRACILSCTTCAISCRSCR